MIQRVPALALAAVLVSAPARAGSVVFEVRVPASTPAGAAVWLSGDRPELGSWSGAGLKLVREAEGVWRGALALPAGVRFEYKVTRGGWETVEKDAQGGEIRNRQGVATGGDDTLRIEVGAWRDQTEAPAVRTHTITGDVVHHPAFASRHVKPRDVWVWRPPGYDADPKRRYPVVYFHDGQNVFDGATSFLPGQEWGADEAADHLIRDGKLPPFIMVAVANTPDRMSEYTSARDAQHGGGGSDAYFRFLVDELMPFVNAKYRTRTDPGHTAVIGSSLGGLAALDLAWTHPERFGLVGCVSPAVWWADTAIVKRVGRGPKPTLRVWLDIGTAESAPSAEGHRHWIDHARLLRDALVARGWREGANFHYEEVEGAPHNEGAWAARVDRILEFLLGAPAAAPAQRDAAVTR